MANPFVAASTEQLAAIAAPGREAIIDAVALDGPCSVQHLAKALRRSRHSLYYHVKALRDCGLLIETRRSGEGTRTTSYYDVPGRPFSVSFDLSSKARRQALLSLARARMRAAARTFERACSSDVATVDGPRRNLRAAHLAGWLSDAELEHANELIEQLIRLVAATRADESAGKRVYELSVIVSPQIPRRG